MKNGADFVADHGAGNLNPALKTSRIKHNE